MIEHLDETGQPCTRHVTTPATLLTFATLGSRMPSFHHDAASKMQSLMMALDEMSELVGAEQAELRQAVDTAHTALRELHQLFTANRALAKAPQRKRTALAELFARAAERFGVKLRGELPPVDVDVAPASIVHGLALLLDLVAGAAHLGRVVDVTAKLAGTAATFDLTGPAAGAPRPLANTADVIALATFLMRREDGDVRCAPNGFTVELPIAQPTQPLPKVQ